MFIHLAHLDHTRHANGLHGSAVEQAIIANDEWLGRIMEATMDTGDYEHTNFAVISDHGHLEVKQVFNPNILLVEQGLITLDEKGAIIDWKAYCNSTSLSCQVVMKDPSDGSVRALLEKLLYGMREMHAYGVESVFTKEEAQREWHLTGDFEYVMEGTMATSFGNACSGSVIVGPDNSNYKFSVASHGHLPHKGAQPVFIIAGPDIRQNVVIERRHIIDEAPTFAKILGFTMPDAKGRVLDEFLK
jgi:predicted AlkP superfamily pyrophosphatase or phosphodiesterase